MLPIIMQYNFDNMWVLIFYEFGLKMPIHAPKRGFGDMTEQLRISLIATPKAPPCVETRHMTYRSSKWVRCGLGVRMKQKRKDRLRKQNVTSHVFAETTHVVAAPHGYACVVTPRHIYIFRVLLISVQGFWSHRKVKFNYSHYSEYWLLEQFIHVLPCKPCTTVQAVMRTNP